jgi:hypothetical protein
MCCSRGIKDKNGARDKERQRRGRGEGGRERARARERESERARSASRSLPTYESTAKKDRLAVVSTYFWGVLLFYMIPVHQISRLLDSEFPGFLG